MEITSWHRATAAGIGRATSPRGGQLHPVMAAALAPFAPPSSSVFDSLREPEEELPMRAFVVTVVRRIDGGLVNHFEAMGRHAVDVTAAHADLAGPGQRVHVMTAEAFELQRKVRAEADAAQARELSRMPLGGYRA